jgi:hypothetical protein
MVSVSFRTGFRTDAAHHETALLRVVCGIP